MRSLNQTDSEGRAFEESKRHSMQRESQKSCGGKALDRYDICIIGGGVLGCLIAAKLAGGALSCVLVEKREDVCLELTKANSAILYPGYDHRPGTLKSRFAAEGNVKTAEFCERLGVPVLRCGSLMIAKGRNGRNAILGKYRQGKRAGIPDLQILERQEILEMEPGISDDAYAALYSPHTAVISPWLLGMESVRLAEKNGLVLKLGTQISGIREEYQKTLSGCSAEKGYILETAAGESLFASCVINAAGIDAHRIRELLFAPKIRIRISLADYLVFGREDNPGLSHVVFYEPEDGKKGVTLVPRPNGSVLAGSTRRIPSSEAAVMEHAADADGIRFLKKRIEQICPGLADAVPIRLFAGLRPDVCEVVRDENGAFVDSGRRIHSFVIEQEGSDGTFISLIGIKTPGITAGVPIAEYVSEMALKSCSRNLFSGTESGGDTLSENPKKNHFSSLSLPERAALAAEDSSFGRIICRCGQITEGEIRDAVRDGAVTTEGIKLRCGAGMGKCQGGRCFHKIEEILKEQISKAGDIDSVSPERRQTGAGISSADTSQTECEILIIGAGAAGLSLAAALKEASPGTDVLLVDGSSEPGGILTQCLHDGFPDPASGRMISGLKYRDLLWRDTVKNGVRYLSDTYVTALHENDDGITAEAASSGRWIRIRTGIAVLAVGAVERTAGMLNIAGSRPSGIYTAGEVQRMLNLEGKLPGKRVVLAGAGNMGLIAADLMIRNGMEVVRIAEAEDHLTAMTANIRKYLEDQNAVIDVNLIHPGSRVIRVHGIPELTGVTVTEDHMKEYIPCDTLVLAAGLVPDRGLLSFSSVRENSGRIHLFGNCSRIFSTVSAIRLSARQTAHEIIQNYSP